MVIMIVMIVMMIDEEDEEDDDHDADISLQVFRASSQLASLRSWYFEWSGWLEWCLVGPNLPRTKLW